MTLSFRRWKQDLFKASLGYIGPFSKKKGREDRQAGRQATVKA